MCVFVHAYACVMRCQPKPFDPSQTIAHISIEQLRDYRKGATEGACHSVSHNSSLLGMLDKVETEN